MSKANSFKNTTSLVTDKKINLVYGLNGTGKSTVSDFLYDPTNSLFSNCSIEGATDHEILVYNQRFIKDYFYQPDNLKCIFTLSKENKEAEEKVRTAEKAIENLNNEKTQKNKDILNNANDLASKKQSVENRTWEIKTKYAGGDRVLEYCLEGLKGSKESVFSFLERVEKPANKPAKTIEQLKKEVEAIQGSTAQKYDPLSIFDTDLQLVEQNEIFSRSIIGNENSTVAALIKRLENSDWVKEGLKYIYNNIDGEAEVCPFCQERTITKTLVDSIREYFDESYENDLKELSNLLLIYEGYIQSLVKKETYEANPFIVEKKVTFDGLYNSLSYLLQDNKDKIAEKLKTPSQKIALESSDQAIKKFADFIKEINTLIQEHNEKIQNKTETLDIIKTQFWAIMRWDYDQTINPYQDEKSQIEKKVKILHDQVKSIEDQVTAQKFIIADQQKKTVNIEEAIGNINNGLLELGINEFHIEKHKENLYKIARTEKCDNIFETLSEGEKMIISFLYFGELCKGKKTATGHATKKIIVIDDPISSLSHIYVFNVGQMIKNNYFNSANYEQIFLLTHSLYFFYEMTMIDYEKRKEAQTLFRLTKNSEGSQFFNMKYEEIQNDYQSYWFIVKDDKQPPALIANCMRNIIE